MIGKPLMLFFKPFHFFVRMDESIEVMCLNLLSTEAQAFAMQANPDTKASLAKVYASLLLLLPSLQADTRP